MHPTLFQPFVINEKHANLSRPSFSSSDRCGLWAVCGPAAHWAGLGWRGASAAALLVGAACNSSRGSSRWNWRTFWTCERVGGEKQHKAERVNQKQRSISAMQRESERHFCDCPMTPNSAPSPSPDTRQRNKNWGLCTQTSSVEPFITYTLRKLKYGTRWSEIIITTAPAAEHRQIHLRQQQIKPIFYETGVEDKIKQRFLFEDKCKTRASSLERSSFEMFLQCSPEQRSSVFVWVPGEPEPARAGVPQMFESAAEH